MYNASSQFGLNDNNQITLVDRFTNKTDTVTIVTIYEGDTLKNSTLVGYDIIEN